MDNFINYEYLSRIEDTYQYIYENNPAIENTSSINYEYSGDGSGIVINPNSMWLWW